MAWGKVKEGGYHPRSGRHSNQTGGRLGEQWQQVNRRKFTRGGGDRFESADMSKMVTIFYVTGFPDRWYNSMLRKAFQGFGVLVDAVVPGRRDKRGSTFGIVKFLKVIDVDSLLHKFNGLVFDGCCIHANISKYGNNSIPRNLNSNQPKQPSATSQDHRREVLPGGNNGGGESFKDAVEGNLVSFHQADTVKSRLLANEDMQKMVYGLGDCSIKYVGGLCVLLVFKSKTIANVFLKTQSVNWSVWFAWLKTWDASFSQQSRIVWLKVSGVPVQFWDPVVFSCIAEKFGRCLGHSIVVQWGINQFKVRVKEDGDWNPTPQSNTLELEADEDEELEGGFLRNNIDLSSNEEGRSDEFHFDGLEEDLEEGEIPTGETFRSTHENEDEDITGDLSLSSGDGGAAILSPTFVEDTLMRGKAAYDDKIDQGGQLSGKSDDRNIENAPLTSVVPQCWAIIWWFILCFYRLNGVFGLD
ncbi:hypothetical protein LXL04_022899 [Taraxacum kok-saghyz]